MHADTLCIAHLAAAQSGKVNPPQEQRWIGRASNTNRLCVLHYYRLEAIKGHLLD